MHVLILCRQCLMPMTTARRLLSPAQTLSPGGNGRLASGISRCMRIADAAAREEVAGLLPRLSAAPGPVLDACCGHGRHLAALRDAGITAVGFDYSAPLLTAGMAKDQARGRLVRADVSAAVRVGMGRNNAAVHGIWLFRRREQS